nr:transcriptional regulator rpn4 [Quercus suber]
MYTASSLVVPTLPNSLEPPPTTTTTWRAPHPFAFTSPRPSPSHTFTPPRPGSTVATHFDQHPIQQSHHSIAAATTSQRRPLCMNNVHHPSLHTAQHPLAQYLSSSSSDLSPPNFDTAQYYSPSLAAAGTPTSDWRAQHTSMGGPTVTAHNALKRTRPHQRTPSASTVNSTGPASPYTQNIAYPSIVGSDYSPAHFAEYPKVLTPSHTPVSSNLLAAGYVPNPSYQTFSAHQAMKSFAIDHHVEDYTPDYSHSSRRSMSSRGNDSPATPLSGVGDPAEASQYNVVGSNGETWSYKATMGLDDCLLFGEAEHVRPANPNVQLFRTESQAYQDELFNPSLAVSAAPAHTSKPARNFLSPHSSVMSQRLQTANIARSQSPNPASAVSRERSPFRTGSPFAANSFPASPNGVGTAASMRQQQKEQAEQAEYARNRPQLNREPTKTISPKDALLDYNESDQTPLFQDNVPIGYKQHAGGAEQWPQGFSFGNLQMQATPKFRATSGDGMAGNDVYGYMNLPPNATPQGQIPNMSYPAASYAPAKMTSYPNSDATPAFPATLTSMESSTGSADDENNHAPSIVRRPTDTRANTGTYTCTYHGCTQRFDSQVNLQKHKREVHRPQPPPPPSSSHEAASNGSATAASSGSGSESPRSSASPDPSTAGMTSAAIMARNSQAGPHRCTRINPSTNKPCNTVFSRPYDLTRHEDTIHNGRKQKVRCPMCREEKTFSRNDALTRHMRVVHPEAEAFGKRGRS